MQKTKLLIVEDEPAVRKLVQMQMAAAGYETVTAANGFEALSILSLTDIDLVLSDVRMPDMDGLTLLASLREQAATRTKAPVGTVLLTGCDDLSLAVQAMQLGALNYVLKPFDPDSLQSVVREALERYQEMLAAWQREQQRERLIKVQQSEIGRLSQQLASASEASLQALVAALDAREHATQHHSQRVSEYAVRLAQALGLDEWQCALVRRGGLLHDIGKIGVIDQILCKPGPLTEEEWVEMRKHPEIGYTILSGVAEFQREAELVLAHHERYDGSGYPQALRGEQIPLAARIFAVADAFDAMTSDRSYRKALSYPVAIQEIERCVGTQFDPYVAGKFLGIVAPPGSQAK